MARLSTSPFRDQNVTLPNHPAKQSLPPEDEARTLEQFVREAGMSATLRGLADIASQWSKQDSEYRAHWEQICLAIHTCAGVKVEPLLEDMKDKPKPFLSLDTCDMQAVVHVREGV